MDLRSVRDRNYILEKDKNVLYSAIHYSNSAGFRERHIVEYNLCGQVLLNHASHIVRHRHIEHNSSLLHSARLEDAGIYEIFDWRKRLIYKVYHLQPGMLGKENMHIHLYVRASLW